MKSTDPTFKEGIDDLENNYEKLIGRFMNENIPEHEAHKLIKAIGG